MSLSDTIFQFLEYIIKGIVSSPDEVVIEKASDDRGHVFTIQVNKDDMGRLIGKSGQTIKAIRTLVKMWSSQNNTSVLLKIVDPLS